MNEAELLLRLKLLEMAKAKLIANTNVIAGQEAEVLYWLEQLRKKQAET